MRNFLTFILFCTSSTLLAQDCSKLEALKQAAYGFKPSQLTRAQQKAKIPQLDKFWNAAKAGGPQGFECVRKLIAAEKTDKYFIFAGTSLLFQFNRTKDSYAAMADGLARTDISDVQPAHFVRIALYLAQNDVDTGAAAKNYLNHPEVTTYLPEHGGFKLGRDEGAILIYGSMSPANADKYLASELNSPNQYARDTAAVIWSMMMTEASFKTLSSADLRTLSPSARKHVETVLLKGQPPRVKPPKHTREQMLALLAKSPDIHAESEEESKELDNSAYATLRIEDLPAYREARRKMVRGVSDESMHAFVEMSRVLMNLVNKLDAYAEFRRTNASAPAPSKK